MSEVNLTGKPVGSRWVFRDGAVGTISKTSAGSVAYFLMDKTTDRHPNMSKSADGDRCVWLSNGRIKMNGDLEPYDVVAPEQYEECPW